MTSARRQALLRRRARVRRDAYLSALIISATLWFCLHVVLTWIF